MSRTLPKVNFALQSDAVSVENTAQKILFVGQMTAAGSATAGTLIKNIGTAGEEDALFGAKSNLAAMVREARRICSLCNNQVRIDVIPLADKTGSTAATGSVVVAGTATEAGTLYISVGSEKNHKYKVDVTSGDTASTVAQAFKTLLDADTNAPVSSSGAAESISLTASNKGTIGNDISLKVSGTVAGISVTLTAFSGGATDPTLPTISTLIGDLRYQGLAYPAQYGADLSTDLLDARFNANNIILDGVAVMTATDSKADLITAYNSENSASLVIIGNKEVTATAQKGGSVVELNSVISAQFIATRALRVQSDSDLTNIVVGNDTTDLKGGTYNHSLPFFNTKMYYLPVIEKELHWTSTEISELKTAGISVLDNNAADNAVVMGEIVTTYKTDSAGNADTTWLYLENRDTGSAVREYRFNNFKSDFAQARARGSIEQEVANAFRKYYKTLAGDSYKLLREDTASFAFYLENLSVSFDYASGTVTIICRDPYVGQVRQADGYFKAVYNLPAA